MCPTKQTGEAGKFFKKMALPLAEKLGGEGKEFFPEKFDSAATTYYVRRKKTTMDKYDFIVRGCESYAGLENALTDMWQSQGYPELVELAPGLSKLAEKLYAAEDESGEVSPFIYVMF
jgi:hypothetical protein